MAHMRNVEEGFALWLYVGKALTNLQLRHTRHARWSELSLQDELIESGISVSEGDLTVK